MYNRNNLFAGIAAVVLMLAPVASAEDTFGGSGIISDTNSMTQTIYVDKYKLRVVPTSIMINEHGRRISFSALSNIDGNVGFTMRKSGTHWELIKLVVEDLEDDE